MKILGIDPSLNSTGYAIINAKDSKLLYIASGVIKHEKNLDLPKKLLNISNAVNDLILEYQPSNSAIEETFVNSNSQTSLKLGMVRGVILSILAKFDISILEIAPNLIKKNIVGNGKADKSQVAFMVKRILHDIPENKTFKTEDETDAIAIAITRYSMR